MFHLRGPSLGVAGVTLIGHRVFTLCREPEFLLRFGVLLCGREFGHNTSPPACSEHVGLQKCGLDLEGTAEASPAVKTRRGVVIHKDAPEAAVAEDSSA